MSAHISAARNDIGHCSRRARNFSATLVGTPLEAKLTLEGSVNTLSIECKETADRYALEWDAEQVKAMSRTFTSAESFYDFIEQSLQVAKPSQPDTPVPGTLTSSVWQGGPIDDPKVFMKSLLHPSHSFLPTLTVDLEFPRVYTGQADQKYAIQLRKQAEWYEESNNGNLQEFKEALIAQEADFQERLEAGIASAVAATEEKMMKRTTLMIDRIRILEARMGDCALGSYGRVTSLPTGTLKISFTTDRLRTLQAETNFRCLLLRYNNNNSGNTEIESHMATRFLAAYRGLKGLCMGYPKDGNNKYKDYGIFNLEFLQDHKDLEELYLPGNKGITDLSPLKNLRCLKVLQIDGCTQVGNISVLRDIPSLAVLYIRDTGLIKACSFLCREGLKIVYRF